MPELKLKNRVAVITGASRGLGEGIAKVMAREGTIAVLFSRDIKLLRKHEKSFRSQGWQAFSFKVDVSDLKQVDRAVKEILQRYGGVDILVNNAGIAPSLPFLEVTDEIRDQVIETNIIGVWNCTKAILPTMIEKNMERLSIYHQ